MEPKITTLALADSERHLLGLTKRSTIWLNVKVVLIGLVVVLLLPFLPTKGSLVPHTSILTFQLTYGVTGFFLMLLAIRLFKSCRPDVRRLNTDLRQGIKNQVIIVIDDASTFSLDSSLGFQASQLNGLNSIDIKGLISQAAPGSVLIIEYTPHSKLLLNICTRSGLGEA